MASAILRGFRESPRKVRVVADMIRGRPVADALSILRIQRRKAAEVHSVEVIPELAMDARGALMDLGYTNIHVHIDDGSRGWPDRWDGPTGSSSERPTSP